MELKYYIVGHPYVKKSNQKVVRRGNSIRKIDTPRYREWHERAKRQLLTQLRPYEPLSKPINLQCMFYVRTKGRVDLSALYEGIQDVLVEMSILADDNCWIVRSHDGSGVWHDKENPRMEITITEATR
jgi:Holliday junction resolvase RusA-like endonuclease